MIPSAGLHHSFPGGGCGGAFAPLPVDCHGEESAGQAAVRRRVTPGPWTDHSELFYIVFGLVCPSAFVLLEIRT